jgi:hypothetical protein
MMRVDSKWGRRFLIQAPRRKPGDDAGGFKMGPGFFGWMPQYPPACAWGLLWKRFCWKALFGVLFAHGGSHPFSELFTTQLSRRKPEDDSLLLINSGVEFMAIQDQEHFHREMTNTLVSIEEGMIADQRESQGGGFGRQAWIQILAAKRHLRLGHR